MPKPDQTDAAANTVDSAPKESPAETVDVKSTVADAESVAAEPTVDAADTVAESPSAESAGDATVDTVDATTADTVDSADATVAETLSANELRAQLDAAQEENAAMKDALLRAKAEVENIRRRSHEEVVKTRKFAIGNFAEELLEVKDNLDRAAQVALDDGAGEAVKQMKEGLGLTSKQLDATLARFAVVEVEAAPGVKFDPQRHQAVSTTPAADIAADHIVEVVQKGFALKERLLRPAMVVVAGGGAA